MTPSPNKSYTNTIIEQASIRLSSLKVAEDETKQ